MFKRLLAVLATALLACAPSIAAEVKFSQLPQAGTLIGSERFVAVQGTGCPTATSPCGNVVISPAQIATFAAGSAAFSSTYQPLDADLTSLAAASGTNTLYYRSAASTWSPVTIGAGANFSGGVLSASGTGLQAANNLSDVANVSTARTNLGAQAASTNLSCIAGLTPALDRITYWTGPGSCSMAPLTAQGRALIDDIDAAAQRTTLGLGTIATAAATDYRLSPPIPAGQYLVPDGFGSTTTAGVAPGADTLKLWLGYVRKDITITGLALRVSTVSAGGNARVAIYAVDPSSGLPTGPPLVSSGALSTASAVGVADTSVSYSISAGWYYFASLVDNSTAAFYSVSMTGGQIALSGSTSPTNIGSVNGLTKSSVPYSSGFPTLTGNRTTDGLTDNVTASMPIVAFKR